MVLDFDKFAVAGHRVPWDCPYYLCLPALPSVFTFYWFHPPFFNSLFIHDSPFYLILWLISIVLPCSTILHGCRHVLDGNQRQCYVIQAVDDANQRGLVHRLADQSGHG